MGCWGSYESLLETEVFWKGEVTHFRARKQARHVRSVSWLWPLYLQLCRAVSGGLEFLLEEMGTGPATSDQVLERPVPEQVCAGNGRAAVWMKGR